MNIAASGASGCLAGDVVLETQGRGPVQARALAVGDFVPGVDAGGQPSWCTVLSVSDHGTGIAFGNFTPNHFVVVAGAARAPWSSSGPNSTASSAAVVMHGRPTDTGEGREVDLVNIVTQCPAVSTADGEVFTPFAGSFFAACALELTWTQYSAL